MDVWHKNPLVSKLTKGSGRLKIVCVLVGRPVCLVFLLCRAHASFLTGAGSSICSHVPVYVHVSWQWWYPLACRADLDHSLSVTFTGLNTFEGKSKLNRINISRHIYSYLSTFSSPPMWTQGITIFYYWTLWILVKMDPYSRKMYVSWTLKTITVSNRTAENKPFISFSSSTDKVFVQISIVCELSLMWHWH